MLATIIMMSWVVPPPSNSGNEGLVRDSLLKMVHNPGGDSFTGRGDNPNDVILPIVSPYLGLSDSCHTGVNLDDHEVFCGC